jgi:large subunit ribosomal protein L18
MTAPAARLPLHRRSTTDLKGSLKTGADVAAAAAAVGKLVAERAVKAGVKEVVFDRGAYIFHGRVKALGRCSARRLA